MHIMEDANRGLMVIEVTHPVPTQSSPAHTTTLGELRDGGAEVICIVVVEKPRSALRAEDTSPGWGDAPYDQLPAIS